MPNANILLEKQAIVAQLAEKMKSASAGVLVEYKGITVENDTKLRRELRQAGVDYSVVKNTLVRRAANEIGFEELDTHLNGTTAMAISNGDPLAPAKILCNYAKSNESFRIKVGFIDGKVVSDSEVKQLAAIPSREILIAKMLGSLNAPISKFVYVLDAIAKKGGEAVEAPAEEAEAPAEAPVEAVAEAPAEAPAEAVAEAPAEEVAEAAAAEVAEEAPAAE